MIMDHNTYYLLLFLNYNHRIGLTVNPRAVGNHLCKAYERAQGHELKVEGDRQVIDHQGVGQEGSRCSQNGQWLPGKG